jgi:hypothetical protein
VTVGATITLPAEWQGLEPKPKPKPKRKRPRRAPTRPVVRAKARRLGQACTAIRCPEHPTAPAVEGRYSCAVCIQRLERRSERLRATAAAPKAARCPGFGAYEGTCKHRADEGLSHCRSCWRTLQNAEAAELVAV